MGMEKIPEITKFENGTKMWRHTFDGFEAKVFLPVTDLPGDIINYGFRAPYLMILEEKPGSMEEARTFAEESGLAQIAAQFAGSVVFFYPTNEGGWENAPKSLYADMIGESRISQYYQDGAAITYDRFAKKMGKPYIRGTVSRAVLYGFGASADYIAKNCLKTLEGDGMFGKGDITPAACVLQGLSVIPQPERRDIPVLSIGNSEAANRALTNALDYVLVKERADYPQDFKEFAGTFRRMVGNLEREPDFAQMGLIAEPGYATVPTSADNRGDKKDTTEHKIGYMAFYRKGIMDDGKKVPLVLCFHGGGDTCHYMVMVSGWYRVAAENDFLLVALEEHMNNTATEVIALLEQLKQKYSIDSEKVYATGFSMGGCKSWDMMQEYPEVFAAIAPMDATFEVGLNAYGESAGEINQDVVLPVFYVGGEITPLPELPFQEKKCLDRMQYVLKVNQAIKENPMKFDEQDKWENPIWGIDGDYTCRLDDPERADSALTLQLFVCKNNKCYCIFGSMSNQGHEVRHHSCDNAWKFLNSFRRLSDGTLLGGDLEGIRGLYGGEK